MSERPTMRVSPGADGVSIWSAPLFGEPGAPRLREFLARAFAVGEVETVEIRRASAFGRVRYAAGGRPDEIWRKLGRSLREDEPGQGADRRRAPVSAASLYLDHPARWPIRVSRVGETLSTWRVRPDGEHRLRLAHPVLGERKAFLHRLEEQLAGILGVEDFRGRTFSSDVLVSFDPDRLSPERLVRELERAWPALIDGEDEPPSNRRLVAAGTLLGLAAAGQFFAPALRPVAVGAVVVYSAPNVAAAIREARRGEIGLPALYSFGLAMMLASGLPLTGTIMASLMQLWGYLSQKTLVDRQRKLFAAHRKRPAWACVSGAEIEVHVDDLRLGDEVVVRRGETVPVDGIVAEGLAALADAAALGPAASKDVEAGDAVLAGSSVLDGEITVRVTRTGDATAAAAIGAVLPRSVFRDLPSLIEAERVANRNARPALALAALNLFTTRSPRFSQAVIRPDYVTAPRLSAQLTALHSLAEALRRGLLVRRPAALDLVSGIDVFVFDDGAGLDRRGLEVARVAAASGASTEEIAAYAAAALEGEASERARALFSHLDGRSGRREVVAHDLRRRAGAYLFRDDEDRQIAIVAPGLLKTAGVAASETLKIADSPTGDAAARPLFVVRDGRQIGVIAFRRQGALKARGVIAALKAEKPKARFVHLSGAKKPAARALADAAGVELAFGGLDPSEKAAIIRGLGRRAIWIGDGTAEGAQAVMAASDVSVSVAGVSGAPDDTADVLLLRGALSGLTELGALARAHKARLRDDYRAVYAANLVGVAGALFARFGSLQSGLLSNLGSGVVYARHVRRLNALIADIEAERRAAG